MSNCENVTTKFEIFLDDMSIHHHQCTSYVCMFDTNANWDLEDEDGGKDDEGQVG